MKPILEIRNISKKYNIAKGKERYLSLRDSLIRGVKSGFKKNVQQEFWALDDITFDVYPGETIGIIGKNGAGKSTLLKILSKITPPTQGYIKARGKIASLLEVGTGFHPELTGRENIFLNGSILGLKRMEIIRKIDEIIDFSGVEHFLDTPLKHYSNGMQLRLAFSVAAHLEPDILIVDEILAVGDLDFQQKCIGKMEEVSQEQGRTILFVSHNMGIIKNLCYKGVLLEKGKMINSGHISKVIDYYVESISKDTFDQKTGKKFKREKDSYGHQFRFEDCKLLNSKNKYSSNLLYGEPFSVYVEATSNINVTRLSLGIRIESRDGIPIIGPRSSDLNIYYKIEKGKPFQASAIFEGFSLVPGLYWVTLTALEGGVIVDQVSKLIGFRVLDATHSSKITPYSGAWGLINYNPRWII